MIEYDKLHDVLLAADGDYTLKIATEGSIAHNIYILASSHGNGLYSYEANLDMGIKRENELIPATRLISGTVGFAEFAASKFGELIQLKLTNISSNNSDIIKDSNFESYTDCIKRLYDYNSLYDTKTFLSISRKELAKEIELNVNSLNDGFVDNGIEFTTLEIVIHESLDYIPKDKRELYMEKCLRSSIDNVKYRIYLYKGQDEFIALRNDKYREFLNNRSTKIHDDEESDTFRQYSRIFKLDKIESLADFIKTELDKDINHRGVTMFYSNIDKENMDLFEAKLLEKFGASICMSSLPGTLRVID